MYATIYLCIYYFGVNVLCWCPFAPLFNTIFQNSRYGYGQSLKWLNFALGHPNFTT